VGDNQHGADRTPPAHPRTEQVPKASKRRSRERTQADALAHERASVEAFDHLPDA